MRVIQTTFGTFHHFDLAHELERRGHLLAILSTFPWQRLKREGLAREYVQTFAWLHTPGYLLNRYGLQRPWMETWLRRANIRAFDWWSLRQVRAMERGGAPVDALIALSGSSLHTGAHVQRRGGIFICDRGSTHQRFQYDVLREEYLRWGLPAPEYDERYVAHEETIYAQADAITVPSTACVRSFLQMGVPASKMHRIPYGVNLQRFKPTGLPPTDRFECLFAGHVSLRKGVPYLLQAFAALRHPHKRLRVVGALQPELKAVLRQLPTEQVEFLGPVPQSQLVDMMSTSHVLVLPSIEEGLALVQAQAMACGCPVVCSTNTGGEDLLEDGVSGFVVPVRDSKSLGERLQRIADSVALHNSLRTAALKRVQTLGGWQAYGDTWVTLLENLTRERQP